jgi:hypothetical protein
MKPKPMDLKKLTTQRLLAIRNKCYHDTNYHFGVKRTDFGFFEARSKAESLTMTQREELEFNMIKMLPEKLNEKTAYYYPHYPNKDIYCTLEQVKNVLAKRENL